MYKISSLRSLRGGAVGGENLGNYANGVGEVFNVGDDGFESLLD